MIPWLYLAVVLVAVQRIAELIYAGRNTRRLLAAGGVEHGAGHYPLFVALHGSWLAVLILTVPPATPPNLTLLLLFVLLQVARVWVVVSLGRFWTTRIITVPGAPLVRRGPYRFLRHPNYLVVTLEIAVLPLAFGAWQVALGFSVLNALLLWHRIRVEDGVLAPRQGVPSKSYQGTGESR